MNNMNNMNNMNQNNMMMQNNPQMMQNNNMMMQNNQMQMQKPQEPDESKLFENELKTAPQSSPNNYVYIWNQKTKKYICYQEPHLYQNHKVDQDTHQYFLQKLHDLPNIDPSARKTTYAIIGTIACFLLAIVALIIAIQSDNSTIKTIFYILMSILILLGILLVIYLILRAKKDHNNDMKLRRNEIRKFLAVNNKMSFHHKNRHWRPSPYCSYITYMMDYYGEKGNFNSNVTMLDRNNETSFMNNNVNNK